MADVLITNVPDGCEDKVKEMAMVAIERFLKTRDLTIDKTKVDKFETDVDTIREANNLDPKYEESIEANPVEK